MKNLKMLEREMNILKGKAVDEYIPGFFWDNRWKEFQFYFLLIG